MASKRQHKENNLKLKYEALLLYTGKSRQYMKIERSVLFLYKDDYIQYTRVFTFMN